MTSRSLILLAGLLLVGPAWAQAPPADRPPKAPPDAAPLERRLAALEDQVAKLLKEVEILRKDLKSPQADATSEFKIFALKHAKASEMAKTLQELLQKKDEQTLRIVADPASNSVVVRGNREQLDVVEAIIARLDELSRERGGK